MKKLLAYLLVMIILTTPFYFEKKVYGSWVTSSDILTVISFVLWMFLLFFKKQQFKFKPPLILLVVLLLSTFFISSVFAVDRFLVIRETVKFIFIFALFYTFVYNFNDEFIIKIVPTVITICAFIVSIWFLIDYSTGKVSIMYRKWERLFGAYTHLNALGTYLIITLPFSFFLINIIRRQWLKFIVMIVVIIKIIALILTQSRGNWIAFIGIVLLLILLKFKLKTALSIFLLICITLVLSNFFVPITQTYKRFLSSFEQNEGSFSTRVMNFHLSLQLIKKYPITGVGLGNFVPAVKKYLGKDIVDEFPHSLFLNYLTEAGFFSLVVLVVLIIKYFRDIFTIYTDLLQNNNFYYQTFLIYIFLSFTGLFVSAQFGDMFFRGTKEFFAFLFSLPYVINSIVRERTFCQKV